MDEFLKYTLRLLEFCNSISSSLSHMGQARLKLSHALSLVKTSPLLAIERLKAIESSSFIKDSIKEKETEENCVEIVNSEREYVIHHALMIMQQIGYWVCGVVILGLCGDVKPYMEMRKSIEELGISSFNLLDSIVHHQAVCDSGSGVGLKEVKEVNDAVNRLVASVAIGKSIDEAEDLQKRLEVFEKDIEDLGKEVDSLFSDVLEERNKLLDCLRQRKQ